MLVALADADDRHHGAASEAIAVERTRIVPEPVVAEADYLIGKYLGVDAEIEFLRSLTRGELVVECPTRPDRGRAVELVTQYRDLELGYADATLVAIAERLGETRVATLDRRHFSTVKPRHADAFELVP